MPIRILLVGAVVFLAAWFTILSPKDPVVPVEPTAPATAPTAPGGAQSKAGSFRDTAKAGAAAAEKDALGAANANIEGETAAPSAAAPSATSSTPPATATRPARPAAEVVPAKAVANLPRDVREGLQDRKVVVLGVLTTETKPWDQMPDDDRAVRNALRDVNRYRGNVVVRQVTIGSLVKYDGMLEALNVTQSPTVVVIDRNRKAVALTGYLDAPRSTRRSPTRAASAPRRSSGIPTWPSSTRSAATTRCATTGGRCRRSAAAATPPSPAGSRWPARIVAPWPASQLPRSGAP